MASVPVPAPEVARLERFTGAWRVYTYDAFNSLGQMHKVG